MELLPVHKLKIKAILSDINSADSVLVRGTQSKLCEYFRELYYSRDVSSKDLLYLERCYKLVRSKQCQKS